ncbi:MAG: hypothetical protein M3N52_04450 [Actinomycetota bacterium]|nr:hypothetical protein [Actinomycetota bacterium]
MGRAAATLASAGLAALADGRGEAPPGYARLLAALSDGRPVDEGLSGLVDDAAAVWSRPGFDTFVSLP